MIMKLLKVAVSKLIFGKYPREAMKFIDNNTLSELDFFWLRKFKASKCLDTLLIQVTGAERKIEQDSALNQAQKFENLTSINTAFCIREMEVKQLTGEWS